MNRSPLETIATRQEAVFGSYEGWRLPRRFAALSREYEALRHSAALVDRSHLGRLRLTGKDALDLLDRMSTNKLDDLQPGQFRGTVLTTGKGRVVDVVTVAALPDHLLLLTSPGQETRVAEWLDMYTFLEECVVQSMSQEATVISLLGPEAPSVLAHVVGSSTLPPETGEVRTLVIGESEATTFRTNPLGVPGYDLMVQWQAAPALWDALFALAGKALTPVGLQALEVVRVENGVGRYGDEYSEAVNPLEGRLRPLISFDKGCYIGQEVIARLNTYDKVQRKLMGFVLDANRHLSKRQHPKVLVEGREVGELTSWVRPPRGRRWLALGYVRRSFAKVGTRVEVAAEEGAFPARVTSLPFRR